MSDLRNELEARLTTFICEEIGRRLDANPEAVRLLRETLPVMEAGIQATIGKMEARLEEMLHELWREAYQHRNYLEGRIERRLTKKRKAKKIRRK